MPTYATPGVYIEEITGPGVITGVGTSTAAFIGPAARGPYQPTTITTFDDFMRIYGRDGDSWPYLEFLGRGYYLGHGVQGFFENGGTRAVIVRVGSGKNAHWSVGNSANPAVEVFRLEAIVEGATPNGYEIIVSESTPPQGTPAPTLSYPTAALKVALTKVADKQITLDVPTAPFIVGDIVEVVGPTTNPPTVTRNRVLLVSDSANGPVLTLEGAPAATATSVRMAAIAKDQRRIRVATPTQGLQPGGVIQVPSTGTGANAFFSIVDRVEADGSVFLRVPFQKQTGAPLTSSIDISGSPAIKLLDFDLRVMSGGTVLEEKTGLSLDPFHSGYVFLKTFDLVRVLPPKEPPSTVVVKQLQVAGSPTLTPGEPDDPSKAALAEYQKALNALADVDDVNIVCAPDAAVDPDPNAGIQKAIIQHCLDKKDRIAVLDVPPGRPPANDPSALSHRLLVPARGGFAALYYPWLLVPKPVEPGQPRPLMPQSLPVPPSGHIAGVYARVDQTLGVHHAPANTEVRGVLGLERVISDREQGLINLEGVNALRIFPGEGRVVVWGARTTGLKEESDWIYVNVRRLMLYIEESIEEGIRWAVFKPNDRPLWQSLKRTIDEFLDRVWRDGGLAGKTREQAYQVRIDEGLNTPADIAKGRLYIEIRVAPVRPAEFIIVRIGLWDGGAEVVEG